MQNNTPQIIENTGLNWWDTVTNLFSNESPLYNPNKVFTTVNGVSYDNAGERLDALNVNGVNKNRLFGSRLVDKNVYNPLPTTTTQPPIVKPTLPVTNQAVRYKPTVISDNIGGLNVLGQQNIADASKFQTVISSTKGKDTISAIDKQLTDAMASYANQDYIGTTSNDFKSAEQILQEQSTPYSTEMKDSLNQLKTQFVATDLQQQNELNAFNAQYEKNVNEISNLEKRFQNVYNARAVDTGNSLEQQLGAVFNNSLETKNKLIDLNAKRQDVLSKFNEAKQERATKRFTIYRELEKEYKTNRKQIVDEIQQARKQSQTDYLNILKVKRELEKEAIARRKESIATARVISYDVASELTGNQAYDQDLIQRYADQNGIDPAILTGYVAQEARKRAVSDRSFRLAQQRFNQTVINSKKPEGNGTTGLKTVGGSVNLVLPPADSK